MKKLKIALVCFFICSLGYLSLICWYAYHLNMQSTMVSKEIYNGPFQAVNYARSLQKNIVLLKTFTNHAYYIKMAQDEFEEEVAFLLEYIDEDKVVIKERERADTKEVIKDIFNKADELTRQYKDVIYKKSNAKIEDLNNQLLTDFNDEVEVLIELEATQGFEAVNTALARMNESKLTLLILVAVGLVLNFLVVLIVGSLLREQLNSLEEIIHKLSSINTNKSKQDNINSLNRLTDS